MARKYDSNHIPYYPDEGCEFADSCLNCSLPKCVLDEPRVGIARAKKRDRNEQIIEKYSAGSTIYELAKEFNVSARTIQRALKKRDGGG